ncbi:class I SAM-dependent methyltransferase [Sinimarinibacterium sp. CAU 1509]|uniref:class I SAM-dependent methyltransferase n=1 Tax=Sinimarinibacterium sp. CAU 1509 TaxID=2562283 RepID=UPI0010ACDC0F|nr:class I SAM-dependent methyltransferase [Sinimarinibacterium sp. CAU 1509]TJY63267.1 class I SAM-dependent methyltransferase [Sinimarinibacterium sp. CAU 1509]
MADTDTVFSGSVAMLYESHLVPLIFEPYAADVGERVKSRAVTRLLEVAAGTGVATRSLAAALNPGTSIVATDLNQAMLDKAASIGTAQPVEWQQANAMALPFQEADFDVVVCQFGAMFFPDKAAAFAEARRVLRPGGTFIFSVWDRIAENEFADCITTALEQVFPEDPPRFLDRTPHGYYNLHAIEQDIAAAGFPQAPQIVTVEARSRAHSAHIPAVAYCQGTPLRNEIEARDPTRLLDATNVAANAIAQAFGAGAVEGKIQAHIVIVDV